MKPVTKNILFGTTIGAWIGFFLTQAVILQEFSAQGAAGTTTDVLVLGIRNDILDDILVVPFFLIFFTLAVLIVCLWPEKKPTKK